MSLRAELIAEQPDQGFISRLKALTEEITRCLDSGQDCSALMEEITSLSGLNYLDKEYFRRLHAHSSVQEFAEMASLPRARSVDDLTKDELVDIARRAMDVTSWDAEYYMELFDKNVPMSGASNLIFHPPDHYQGEIADYKPEPEEIVDWATSEDRIIQL